MVFRKTPAMVSPVLVGRTASCKARGVDFCSADRPARNRKPIIDGGLERACGL